MRSNAANSRTESAAAAPQGFSPLSVRPVPQAATEAGFAPVIRLSQRRRPSAASVVPERTGRRDADVISLGQTEQERQVCAIARNIAQATVEVLAGTRSVQQLARWLDQRSFEALQLRTALTRSHASGASALRSRQLHRNPTVRSVRACPVREGVYEASLVVTELARSRAIAIRLEERHGVWKVAAMEIG
jgi:hypothetical protein